MYFVAWLGESWALLECCYDHSQAKFELVSNCAGGIMKIAAIDVYQVDLPYAGGTYQLSSGREYTSFDATFVLF